MNTRKKILIVDYRPEGHRGYDSFPSVEFHNRYPQISERKPEEFATVFVHEGNHPEKSWVERYFHEPEDKQRLFFFFSANWDGKPAPEPLGPGFKLGRQRFLQYVPNFLTHYEKTGELREEFFRGEEPSAQACSVTREDSLSNVPRLVFTDPAASIETLPGDVQEFPIIRDASGNIDFFKTLEPLSGLPSESVRLICVKENYSKSYDGIELAWHIRLAAFLGPFSTFPIYLQLASDIPVILKTSPRWAQLLFGLGTYLSVPLQDYRTLILTPQSHEAMLLQIAVPVPERMTTHDLANEWGALQFLEGYNSLTGSSVSPIAQRSVLLEREYYWLLLSRAHYSKGTSLSNSNNTATEWSHFLASLNNSQDILLIDDHADKGWSSALRAAFTRAGNPLLLNLVCYPSASGFNGQEAIELAVNRSWNLIFCDLRLTESDNHIQRAFQLSGVQLITEIKRQRPDIPLIAFTASEKAWNYSSALDAGADACWIKEGPSTGNSTGYSAYQVGLLLANITHVVTKKRLSAKLWNSYARITSVINNPASLIRWPPLPGGVSNLSAEQHLKAIAERLRRAYGYLEAEPSEYYQQEFKHNPRDLAFLMVWSCINEIMGLYFAYNEATPTDYYYLDRQPGSSWHWHKYAWLRPGSSNQADFEASFKALGIGNVALGRKEIKFENKYSGSNRGKIFGTEHIQLLLRAENQVSLEDNFLTLRDLRNKLDMEHGNISSRQHAVQSHIDQMLDVISYFVN